MSRFEVAVDAPHATMAELRPRIEAAIHREGLTQYVDHRWEGDVLHLEAPGASATVVLDRGRLRARARLGLAAMLMRPMIEERLRSALESLAAEGAAGNLA